MMEARPKCAQFTFTEAGGIARMLGEQRLI